MEALVRELARGDAVFLLHANADPDCVGAAFGLQHAFGGTLVAARGVALAGRNLARAIGADIRETVPATHGLLVVVDTSSRGQVPDLAGDYALVDHHAYGDLVDGARLAFRDATRSSCCEVVLHLLREAKRPLDRETALALLVGIVTDTARFEHADARTLEDAATLLRSGDLRFERDVFPILAADDDADALNDVSRRLAALAGGQRAVIERAGAFLLVTSEVSSHEAAAALALVRAGADLAVVASERGDRARLSLRASPTLRAAGVHLGALANDVARSFTWSGGGHEGAAGLNGPAPAAPLVANVLALVRDRLRAPSGKPK
ncbi:MAG: DHH family phosphoesterase [Thermoplasmatota archaeon]